MNNCQTFRRMKIHMEPVEDEQQHRLHNNDNAETEAPALQHERENDELPTTP